MNLTEYTQVYSDPQHPSVEELNAFAVGQLTENDSLEVEQHLALCDSCNQQLETSPDDPFVALLQKGDSPIRAGSSPAMDSSRSLRFVPGYLQMELLGEGGMGVVYKARHEGLNRLVALKRLRSAGAASSEAQARFRREAEAVARLRHPNIVQIYDVGEQDGEPYLALEYVVGGSLAQKLAAGPLPPRQAAALVETLARAMHHAHEYGIIHRDLKPANVLLDRDGSPKIGDFGLAKQLDEASGQTQTGAILGTPSYMAPEQAGGEADKIGPAADVYALGAILYETLTSRPPFRGPSVLETLAQVREREPVPPKQLQPNVPRDVQIICLKCLHKDPRRRYGSALELAEDLRRFTAGEPIRARPVGFGERVWKWVRRRPAVAALAACTFVAAVALIAGGLVYQIRLRNALDRAESNSRKMLQAWDSVIEVAERNALDVDEEELLRIFEKPRLAYEELLRENKHDPAIRVTTARLCWEMGGWKLALGRLDEAESDCQQALALYQQLVADFPSEAQYRRHLADTLFLQANLRETQGRRKEAVAAVHQARFHWKELPPDQPQDRIELAWACNNLGLWSEDEDERPRFYQEALALVEDRNFGGSPPVNRGLVRAAVYTNLGNSHLKQGRAGKAEAAYQKALAAAKSTGPLTDVRGPTQNMNPHSILAGVYHDLAAVRWKTDPKKAEELYLQALRLRQQIADRHPHVVHLKKELALNHESLVSFYTALHRSSSSEEHLREAVKLREQMPAAVAAVSASRAALARDYSALARICEQSGRRAEAETEARKGVELLDALVRDQPHERLPAVVLSENLLFLGHFQTQNKKPQEGIATLTRAVALLEDLLRQDSGDRHVRTLLRGAYAARATALNERGEMLKAAVDLFRFQALEQPSKSGGSK